MSRLCLPVRSPDPQRGSSRVVISDYATSADQALLVPIKVNIGRIQPAFVPYGTLHAVGHVWGHSVEGLLDPLDWRADPTECASGHAAEVHQGASVRAHASATRDQKVENGSVHMSSRMYSDPNVSTSQSSSQSVPHIQPVGFEEGTRKEEEEEEMSRAPQSGAGKLGRSPGAVGMDAKMDWSETGKPSREDCIGEATTSLERGFDIVIMADLLFNRSQHPQLLASCCRCLGSWDTAEVWVSFSHHDPEKMELDMKFFDLARDRGLQCEHVRTVQRRDLFVEDDGKDELRGAVHIWRLTRGSSAR